MNIYVTGPVGRSGAARLYEEHREQVRCRFSKFFLSQMEALLYQNKNNREIILANCKDCIYICTIIEGGLYGALWESCTELKCGCEILLEDIPIDQEIVEITELTGDNPYEIESAGTYLIFSEKNLPDLKESLPFEQTAEAFDTDWELHLIGRTTKKKDRVVLHGENRRFLTPPGRQQTDIANRKITQ